MPSPDDFDPCRLSPPVDPLTNFPPRGPGPARAARTKRPPSRSRPRIDPLIDPGAVARMSEDERMDAVMAVLRLLSAETIRIAFASGRSATGRLSLKQRRAAHRSLFRSALKRIRAIDPSLLRE